jgi:hypothetical protein
LPTVQPPVEQQFGDTLVLGSTGQASFGPLNVHAVRAQKRPENMLGTEILSVHLCSRGSQVSPLGHSLGCEQLGGALGIANPAGCSAGRPTAAAQIVWSHSLMRLIVRVV